MISTFTMFLEIMPAISLVITLSSTSLLIFMILKYSPKFLQPYSIILLNYTICNLVCAALLVVIKPRIWEVNEQYAFSSRLQFISAITPFALCIHLVHYSMIILIILLVVRLLTLKGLHLTERFILIISGACYVLLPGGIMALLHTIESTFSIFPEDPPAFVVRLHVITFFDFIVVAFSLFMPIGYALIAVILNLSLNALIFSKDISLGYVHRVLICKKLTETIWLALAVSCGIWGANIFDHFTDLTSHAFIIFVSLFFAFSPFYLMLNIRPFHEKIQSFFGRRTSESSCKTVSVNYGEAPDTFSRVSQTGQIAAIA